MIELAKQPNSFRVAKYRQFIPPPSVENDRGFDPRDARPIGELVKREIFKVMSVLYLCRRTLDIMIALKICAGKSRYFLPSRYDAAAPMSRATFNRITYAVVDQAKKEGCR